MAFAFKPNDASSVAVVLGIDHEFANYIIQDENITEQVDSLQVPDQKGKVAQVHALQRRWSATMTLVGPVSSKPCSAGDTFQWYKDGTNTKVNYFVNSCELRSTYNDTAKWSVQMDCYQDAVYSKSELGDL